MESQTNGEYSPAVAVIGAGICGLIAARYLKSAGVQVTLFERSSSLGGVWPPEPRYPSTAPSLAEIIPEGADIGATTPGLDEQSSADFELQYAPPGPAYQHLKNNIPTSLMRLQSQPWRQGTQDYVSHKLVLDYIRAFSEAYELEKLIHYNTRVENVVKQGSKWRLSHYTLNKGLDRKTRYTLQERVFDAVVVATGHYTVPMIPDISGLSEWKTAWPHRVWHSKSYRSPDSLKGKNVLLIGAGVSSTDIANDLSTVVGKIYQVSRPSNARIPSDFLPSSAERVPEIAEFGPVPASPGLDATQNSGGAPIPSTITLVNGRRLDNIHAVIICTGYLISFPFLRHLHSDQTPREAADERVLVTDGSMIHNLYKDIFYMPDPTLSFVGTAYSVTSFALFEYQAMAVAGVLSGRVKLPAAEEARAEYMQRIARKGLGRRFHTLKEEELTYVSEIVAWLNQGKLVRPVTGFSEQWLSEYTERREWLKKVFAGRGSAEIGLQRLASIDVRT